MLINFWGFYQAQPFQGHIIRDQQTDLPSLPVRTEELLVSTFFEKTISPQNLSELLETIKALGVEEHGRIALIPVVAIMDSIVTKCSEVLSKRKSDAQKGFIQTYTRYQRSIMMRTPNARPGIPRMDWRTFRDFIKPIRPDLSIQDTNDFSWRQLNTLIPLSVLQWMHLRRCVSRIRSTLPSSVIQAVGSVLDTFHQIFSQ